MDVENQNSLSGTPPSEKSQRENRGKTFGKKVVMSHLKIFEEAQLRSKRRRRRLTEISFPRKYIVFKYICFSNMGSYR